MKLGVLTWDEILGFYRHKVMLFLWVGLPALVVLLRIINLSEVTDDELTFVDLSAILVSTLGGTLGSIMLMVTILHERLDGVYEPFLVRPIQRWELLMARFLAVFGCIAVAGILANLAGVITDLLLGGSNAVSFSLFLGSTTIALAGIGISCAAGVLIGVASPSVLLGVILVIYGGNQVASLAILPRLLGLELANENMFIISISLALTVLFLLIAMILFERQQF